MYNNLKYFFQSDGIIKEGFKLYESNIDPFLRFIHLKQINPCGWIKVNNYSLENIPDTICNWNITADWNDIQSMNINKIAPLLIASFDIECTSSHGDFPVAIKNYKKLAQDLCYLSKLNLDDEKLCDYIYNAYFNDVVFSPTFKINRLYSKSPVNEKVKETLKTYEASIRFILSKVKTTDITIGGDDEDDDEEENTKKLTSKEYTEIEDALNTKLTEILPALEGDKIIQIGTTVHRFGSDEIIYKNIITLDSCDEIDDVDVKSCKTEADLLISWKRLMSRLNPDIIIGYNIWGFELNFFKSNEFQELGGFT